MSFTLESLVALVVMAAVVGMLMSVQLQNIGAAKEQHGEIRIAMSNSRCETADSVREAMGAGREFDFCPSGFLEQERAYKRWFDG